MIYRHDYQECRAKQKQKNVFLKCGQGAGSRTFTSSNDTPFQIGFVTVEYNNIHKGQNLIKFSSLVRLIKSGVISSAVTLQYELFRSCDSEEEPLSLGTWMFQKFDFAGDRFNTIEEPFNFIFCDKSKCHSCCTYFVRVTPIEITNSTVIVSDGRMVALSEESCQSLDHKSTKDTNITMVCGKGNGGIVFKEDGLRIPADIAHVTIDASYLMNPQILIEFSSIIKLAEDIQDAILRFELFRVCDDGEPLSRGSWIFEHTNSDVLTNRTFSFIFCDCEMVSNCCEYFVRITPIDINEGGGVNDDVTVYDARIVAVIQSGKIINPLNKFKCLSNEVMLECGDGAGSRTFTSQSEEPFQLAHVSVDTSFLCDPMVNIEFSSIVAYQLTSTSGSNNSAIQLRYELFRQCDCKRAMSIGVWEFERTRNGAENFGGSETFDFIYCDDIICPGCCDYFVTVTAIEITEETGVLTLATVSNGRIAALVEAKAKL